MLHDKTDSGLWICSDCVKTFQSCEVREAGWKKKRLRLEAVAAIEDEEETSDNERQQILRDLYQLDMQAR